MLDRRGFLKFIGGAAVGTLATPVVWKGLDDISIWSQNWPWIPSLQYGNHENHRRSHPRIALQLGHMPRIPGRSHGKKVLFGQICVKQR